MNFSKPHNKGLAQSGEVERRLQRALSLSIFASVWSGKTYINAGTSGMIAAV